MKEENDAAKGFQAYTGLWNVINCHFSDWQHWSLGAWFVW